MSALRPLPSRPSLEYARKEAKALLRRLRVGDPEAVARARARHPQIDAAPQIVRHVRLADAQLVFAREHGFASWPRLVRYVGDVERQQHALTQLHGGPDLYEWHARAILADHRARRPWAGRALGAYVPRCYGLRVEEVFAVDVDEDDARLTIARLRGAPSWPVLLERLADNARTQPGDWESDPMRRAADAMAALDVEALERVVAAHPELLHPSQYDGSAGRTLMSTALWQERRLGADAMRPIMHWLAARGFDRARELGTRLCGHPNMQPDEVRAYLDQGADPNWVAPNGIPVLEHALLRYKNGAAVDVLAAHTTPRHALWIAAGLGDVDGVRRFLDRDGKPIAAARRLRPDFVAVAALPFLPPLPDPDDEELLVEALLVAMLNGRVAVIDYLASRGAPVNSPACGAPLVAIAMGNWMPDAVEALVRAGADVDVRSRLAGDPERSAREMARTLFEQTPNDPVRRRMLVLCGLDPDAVLAERDARPLPPPRIDASLRRLLALAGVDAARLGAPAVGPEHLLVGLLRAGGPPLHFLKEAGRLDVERLHADLGDRIAPAGDKGAGDAAVPLDADGQAAMDAALAEAAARRHEVVWGLHLLHALTRAADGPAGRLLARYGVSVSAIHEQAGQAL